MDSFHLYNIELNKTSLNFNCCFQISLMCFPVISCWLFWGFPILRSIRVPMLFFFLLLSPAQMLIISRITGKNPNELFAQPNILRFLKVVYHWMLFKVYSVWLSCFYFGVQCLLLPPSSQSSFMLDFGRDNLCICAKLLPSCPILHDLMDCSPARLLYEILQARILEWVTMPSSRGSSQSRDWTQVFYVSFFGRWVLYH